MKISDFWSSDCLFIELGQSSLSVLNGERGLDLPLERLETGRLSEACKTSLVSPLRDFVRQKPWQLRPRAFCAVAARGVSLRRLTLPVAPDDELRRLLGLQMESEFPLPPSALAWGFCRLNGRVENRSERKAGQELVVAALKREALEDYAEVFEKCGLSPIFTLAASARGAACPRRSEVYRLLDLGPHQSELANVEQGTVTSIRVLPWGEEELTRAIERKLGVTREQAANLKADRVVAAWDGEQSAQFRACVEAEAKSLASLIGADPLVRKVYVTGEAARVREFWTALTRVAGSELDFERIEFQPGAGRTAATIGLQRLWAKNDVSLPLRLHFDQEPSSAVLAPPVRWQWAALVGLLVVASLSLRYADALLNHGRLSRKLSQIKTYREGLPIIDRELSFFQYLETNQPPMLDALYVLANAAPSGTRLDAISMSRRGEVAVRGMVPNAQLAIDFRSKLIGSAFFDSVVLDEQTPTPDRQRLLFRLSAQLKPASQRPPISPEPAPIEAGGASGKSVEKAKSMENGPRGPSVKSGGGSASLEPLAAQPGTAPPRERRPSGP